MQIYNKIYVIIGIYIEWLKLLKKLIKTSSSLCNKCLNSKEMTRLIKMTIRFSYCLDNDLKLKFR